MVGVLPGRKLQEFPSVKQARRPPSQNDRLEDNAAVATARIYSSEAEG